MIIGLTGFARTGKDTVGKILTDNYDFKRASFAEKLKEFAYAADPYVRSYVRDLGWEAAKDTKPLVRECLQTFGVAARETFGQDFWIKQALTPEILDGDDDIVVTDVRFRNEAEAIFAHGGYVLRIDRPGVGPVNDHISDAGLPDSMIDYVIQNDGTVDDLIIRVDDLLVMLITLEMGR